jgi:AAA family ATP:ADP antiporter
MRNLLTHHASSLRLDNESRTKGKAAVDVMGSQMGKALGSCLQQVLLLVGGGSLFNVVPVMAVVFVLALQQWIASVRALPRS